MTRSQPGTTGTRAGDDGDISPSDGTSRQTRGSEIPVHNWRQVLVYGLVCWAVVLVAAILLPTDHPLQLGVTIAGLFAVPLLPVALCCDYRQARRAGTCEPGPGAFLVNLGHDIAAWLTRQRSLGDGRRAFSQC